MDFFLGTKLFEKFTDPTPAVAPPAANPPAPSPVPAQSSSSTTVTVVASIISLLIGLYAAYLSWDCNSSYDMSTAAKVLYAVAAFIFGLAYLIFYAIVRAGTCLPSRLTK